MKQSIRKTVAIFTALFVGVAPMTLPSTAHATGLVAGATEFTQIANNIELVMQEITQAQQLVQQINMYQSMLKNLQNIPTQMFSPIMADLAQVQSIAKGGLALSFASSNIASQMGDTYKGFTQADKFKDSYQKWSQTTMDSIKGTLEAHKMTMDQFSTEESTMSTLRSHLGSSGGALQALQAGGEIAAEQVSQLQKLRQTMVAQSQAQTAFMAQATAEKDNRNAAVDNAVKPLIKTGNGTKY